MSQPPSPGRLFVLQSLHNTGLANRSNKEEFFPFHGYMRYKDLKNPSQIPPHIMARIEKMKNATTLLSVDTVRTFLVCHPNVEFIIEAVNSLSWTNKHTSKAVQACLDELKETYDVQGKMYRADGKHFSLDYHSVFELRAKFIRATAIRVIKRDKNVREYLDDLMRAGLQEAVKKILDMAFVWCSHSKGTEDKLYIVRNGVMTLRSADDFKSVRGCKVVSGPLKMEARAALKKYHRTLRNGYKNMGFTGFNKRAPGVKKVPNKPLKLLLNRPYEPLAPKPKRAMKMLSKQEVQERSLKSLKDKVAKLKRKRILVTEEEALLRSFESEISYLAKQRKNNENTREEEQNWNGNRRNNSNNNNNAKEKTNYNRGRDRNSS